MSKEKHMVTVLVSHKDERGKAIPITFPCFIMYKDKYLAKDGTLTDNKKNAVVVASKGAAKNFVTKYLKQAKVVQLTQQDFEVLQPKQEQNDTAKEESANDEKEAI